MARGRQEDSATTFVIVDVDEARLIANGKRVSFVSLTKYESEEQL